MERSRQGGEARGTSRHSCRSVGFRVFLPPLSDARDRDEHRFGKSPPPVSILQYLGSVLPLCYRIQFAFLIEGDTLPFCQN